MTYSLCVRPVWRVPIQEVNMERLSKGCKSLMCRTSMRISKLQSLPRSLSGLVCREAYSEESRTTIPIAIGTVLTPIKDRGRLNMNCIPRQVWAGESAHLDEALQVY